MKNIFEPKIAAEIIARLNNLQPTTQPLWGKMNVSQMLAHCNVTYELVFENKHAKPGALKQFILTLLVKPAVVSEKPYKKSSPTGAQFLIKETKNFTSEKLRLIDFINNVTSLGQAHFEGKISHSFGALKTHEWNNMFYKHLDHHLTQFGV